MTDHSAERLAAYVSGDLDADERTALEEELARDPDLHAQVEAIRAADEALAGLPDPEPSAAFSERLRTAVDEELDRQLGDELAPRRARRERRDWTPLAAAAAAAIVVLGGVGIVVTTVGGGDDQAPETAGDRTFETGAAEEAAPAQDGPVVLASGRDHDEESVRALLGQAPLAGVADRALEPPEADRLAARYRESFGLSDAAREDAAGAESLEAPAQEDEAADGSDTAADADAPAPAPELPLPGLSAAEAADVRRCLPELMATEDGTVIPVYAEVATFDGQPAIVYGLVSQAPGGTATRTEAWVVSRAPDCRTLYFTQDG